jgi:hypothetical protein
MLVHLPTETAAVTTALVPDLTRQTRTIRGRAGADD